MSHSSSSEIYLDSNATTPVLPKAAQQAFDAMEEMFGNPSSSHTSGLRARNILESTRELVRNVIGAQTGQIVFTSGATEAIQMGIFSTLCHARQQRHDDNPSAKDRTILFGATEHKAVPQAIKHWNHLLGLGYQVIEIPVDRNGLLDLNFLREHAASADLVCTMAVNNETGVIHNLAEIEDVLRASNSSAKWMVDCVQAIGKIPLDLSQTSIDYAAISGHKIYAPKGIGVLYVRENAPLIPLLAGGGQEQGARGGTENLPGVAAIGAVLELLSNTSSRTFREHNELDLYRDQLVAELTRAFPSIVFNSPFEHSVATTINFAVPGFSSKELLDLFDAAGIRVSSGSACGSAVQGSYVLEAMGLPRWQSDGAIRLSFGPLSTESEIQAACKRIALAGQALHQSCLVVSDDAEFYPDHALDGLVQLKSGSMCTWVLLDSTTKNCIIIDPFEELAERVVSLVRCQQSRVLAILDTHAHVDHASCRTMLMQLLADCAHESAATDDLLGWPEGLSEVCELADGSRANFLRLSSKIVLAQTEIPGHTEIGQAYLLGRLADGQRMRRTDIDFAFTGNTILIGGIGRSDFPSSNAEALVCTLKRLPLLISDQTILCPTHDYNNEFATTLASERVRNEFLRRVISQTVEMSLDEFLVEKQKIDGAIDDASQCELVCGLIRNDFKPAGRIVELRKQELKEFFEQHKNSLIIDVREPHEFAFAQDWSEIGFDTPPENVPLTRLVGYLPELINRSQESSIDVIFLCRSGKRSGIAATVSRRVGIKNAVHIAGGIALNVSHKSAQEEHVGFVI